MKSLRLSCLVGAVAALASPAHGVLIAYGDGAANTTSQFVDFGFDHVGQRNSGTAVYLGEGWVLTANHVGAGTFILGDKSYAAIDGTSVRLRNAPGPGDTDLTDLLMFRIADPPPLPTLPIARSVPDPGELILMAGVGRDRQSTSTHWTLNWSESAAPAEYEGFKWMSSRSLRWGTNRVDEVSLRITVQGSTQRAFSAAFDEDGTVFEAHGVSGDSGGPVFHRNAATGRWELAGVMQSITQIAGQPWSSSVYGNTTFAADLSVYRDQIMALIPQTGDLNFDGVVDIMDVAQISNGWGSFGPMGDANYDSVVDVFDVAVISNQWGAGKPVAATVPEPATAVLALFASTAVLAASMRGVRSRRRRCL